jgi:hypothetical protein
MFMMFMDFSCFFSHIFAYDFLLLTVDPEPPGADPMHAHARRERRSAGSSSVPPGLAKSTARGAPGCGGRGARRGVFGTASWMNWMNFWIIMGFYHDFYHDFTMILL